MARIQIRPRASADLIEIWSYIADDSVANADKFIDRLHATMQMLVRQPGAGRRREEIAPGIHSFPFARYIIFYLATSGSIEIVRVLHASRDIDHILEKQEED